MLVRVLLASETRFGALSQVLAELDDARRTLEPSGVMLDVLLLGQPAEPDQVRRIAAGLGLPLSIRPQPTDSFAAALLEGFETALKQDAEVIVSLDADGQHDARQIPDLVRSHLARGSGLTIGSRWCRGGSSPGTSLARSIASRSGNAAVKLVTGARGVSDSTTSFRVYRPDVARVLLDEALPRDTYGFFSAMVAVVQAHGFAVDEVPIVFRPRFAPIEELDQHDVRSFVRSLGAVRTTVHRIHREMRSDQAVWAQRNPRLRAQAAGGENVFGGLDEIANLASADHFLTWIADELLPHLGTRVVEVGAGVGSIAVKLAVGGRQVLAIEPADNVFPTLLERIAGNPAVTATKQTSQELLAERGPAQFDSAVYVSVLEHIRDDVGELRTAATLLEPGGTVGIFVPAMPSLYGSLDYKSGHFRRYDHELLTEVIANAGLELVDIKYFDLLGAFPYFLMYRVLDVGTLESGSSAVYDRAIVPLSRALQRVVRRPPLGKNLVAIARTPG